MLRQLKTLKCLMTDFLGNLWRSRGCTKGTQQQGLNNAETFLHLQKGINFNFRFLKNVCQTESSQVCDGPQGRCVWTDGRTLCQARTVQAGCSYKCLEYQHCKQCNHDNQQKTLHNVIMIKTGLQPDRGHEGEDRQCECGLLHQPRHCQGCGAGCRGPTHR